LIFITETALDFQKYWNSAIHANWIFCIILVFKALAAPQTHKTLLPMTFRCLCIFETPCDSTIQGQYKLSSQEGVVKELKIDGGNRINILEQGPVMFSSLVTM
jgi:hypothetical protein